MRPNPLLPGFNPDPSIVRVEDTYYLVTSTFEYLPGIPVYRSTDLVDWEQIGNVATRPEQVDLGEVPTPGGVWAPTIRHHAGVFHVIVTVMLGGRGCVVFTATDPAGPWSDGTPVPAVDGIDPDLAWDDEGTAYVTYARYPDAIRQVRVDLATGDALEESRALWAGSGLYAPEGPHLHRRDGWWYLVVAEGGTDRGHVVTVARGPAPDGPFEACPDNPVITARSTGSPVQNLGHADLVETPDGTVMVLLGVRATGLGQSFSPLGRETFTTDVRWVDGWPQVDPVRLSPREEVRDLTFDFTDPTALDDPGWISVRRTPHEVGSLTARPGRLTVTADGSGLDSPRPWFVGRRVEHLTASISARVDVAAGTGGLAARHDERHWFGLEARADGAATIVTARAVLVGLDESWEVSLPTTDLTLRIEMTRPPSGFVPEAAGGGTIRLVARGEAEDVVLCELDGRYWSFETAQSFTGRVVGLYAVEGTVFFGSFRYRGTDSPSPDASSPDASSSDASSSDASSSEELTEPREGETP